MGCYSVWMSNNKRCVSCKHMSPFQISSQRHSLNLTSNPICTGYPRCAKQFLVPVAELSMANVLYLVSVMFLPHNVSIALPIFPSTRAPSNA